MLYEDASHISALESQTSSNDNGRWRVRMKNRYQVVPQTVVTKKAEISDAEFRRR
jgi:hypothetical protein